MIKIIGHRGCMEKNHTGQNLYENSLKALSFGLQHSDGIEFDCVRSADRDIFIVHDTVFDGIVQYELARHLTPESSAFLKGRRLDELTTAEAQQLRLRGGDPIPQISDLMQQKELIKGKLLNYELKGQDIWQDVLNGIQDYQSAGTLHTDQLLVSSFDHKQLEELHAADPTIPIGVLYAAADSESGHRLFPWNKDYSGCYIPFHPDRLHELTFKPNFINIEQSTATTENLRAIKEILPEAHVAIWPFLHTEPRPANNQVLTELLDDPVSREIIAIIITNFPKEMIEVRGYK